MWTSKSFLAILSASVSLVSATNYGATANGVACSFNTAPSQFGFDVLLYEYDFLDTTDFNTDAYVKGGYLSRLLIGTNEGVTDYNIMYNNYGNVPVAGEVFGIEADSTNFTAELTSYFYAIEDGYYHFELNYIDDSVGLFFASDGAFVCCTDRETPSDTSSFNYNILTSKAVFGDKDVAQYYYQYLEKDRYYPLKIIFTNIVGGYNLSFTVTTPSGINIITGDSGYYFTPTSADNSADNVTKLQSVRLFIVISLVGQAPRHQFQLNILQE